MRESAATIEENYKSFHQEEGIIVNLFEEALSFRSPRSMEEDTAPPWRNYTLLLGGMRATRSLSMRFTERPGRTEEPPVRPHHLTRSSASPPYALRYSDGLSS
jgi:hypothetical protein